MRYSYAMPLSMA